jgi:hypothetical protein
VTLLCSACILLCLVPLNLTLQYQRLLSRTACIFQARPLCVHITYAQTPTSVVYSTPQQQVKYKGKYIFRPLTGHEDLEGAYRYSCALSLTSALDGVGSQHQAPVALPPGKRRGTPCAWGWIWPQDRSGRIRKISPPPGFDLRTVHSVASRYTDWDTVPVSR